MSSKSHHAIPFCPASFVTRTAFGFFAAGLMLASPHPGAAQTVLGTAAIYQIPGLSSDGEQNAQGSPAILRSMVSVNARLQLRHLPASAAGWRMEGEIGSLDWRVFMTASEASDTKRFRLSYVSSASVLPDVSNLSLLINDVNVGKAGIAAPGQLKPVDFEIPPHLLRQGFNDVKIVDEQRHRVDCSVDATYELWTDIDAAHTGFVITGQRFAPTTAELAALRPRADGSLVIRVLFEGKMNPQRIDRTLLAAQAIALAGRSERLLVSFSPDPEARFGINLAVGGAAEVANVLNASGENAPISGPSVLMKPDRAGAAPTLIVTGANDDDVEKAIEQLLASVKADAAATNWDRHPAKELSENFISGGERLRMGTIGHLNAGFSGRFFRMPIDIRMPSDFLAADYGKLSFNLSGAYSDGLLSNAQIQVNLNGKDAASVPLSNPNGGRFRYNDITVPLTALHPGRNRIEITAKLPSHGDQICDDVGSPEDTAKRFLLLGESEIRFPQFARVGQMPDLSQTAAGGFPYSAAGSHPKLYVPTPDRDSLSAAITLAVRLSVAARHSIPFALVLSNPPPASGNGLVVAAAPSLDPALMREIGMDPEAIRRGWEQRTNVSENTPVVTKAIGNDASSIAPMRVVLRTSQTTLLPPDSTEVVSDGPGTAPMDGWAGLLARRSFSERTWDEVRNATRRASDAVAYSFSAARDQILARTTPSKVSIGSTASLIVAQGYRYPDGADIITIVTAPDSATLAHSVEALVDPAQWSGLAGRLAVTDSSAQVLETVEPANVRLIQTQPATFENTRLIAAGWLSLHPAAYVLAALLMAALLAFTTHSLVKNVGRKNG